MPNDGTTPRTQSSWVDYIVTAKEIEEAVQKENPAFKLFSTLSISVQKDLKTKLDKGLASSLFTDLDSTSSAEIIRAFPDKSIVINGVVVESAPGLSTRNASTASEVSLSQVGTGQNDLEQSNTSQVGSSQVGTSQVGFLQLGTSQVGISQIGTDQIGTSQIGTSQSSTSQIGTSQSSIDHLGISQVGFTQIDPTPDAGAKINFSQVSPIKISFPSIVATSQFFDIHNTSPTSLYDINNTALTLWNTYLQPTTPLNLTIEIKDLPTGQLAEAQITQFSNNGTPTGGTLYLDTDANGLGWFIDTTPWDKSEFSQTLTDTAYRATPDSLASGHYDLLTTLLHETSHLQGFIAGYSGFDSHIQTINGSKTFVGDGFSAILTPDGSHLDSSVYAYDVMNATLTPGVRKLPSALDLQLLNAIQSAQFSTTPAQICAQTTLASNVPPTYTWNFGHSSAPITGQSITHTGLNLLNTESLIDHRQVL